MTGNWQIFDLGQRGHPDPKYQEYNIECPNCRCMKVYEIYEDPKYDGIFPVDVGEHGRCSECKHEFKALRRHLKPE